MSADHSVKRRWRPSLFLRLSAALHLAALGVALVPGGWRPALAALLADHLTISLAGVFPRSRLLGPNLTRLPRTVGAAVALTFDDGPDPEVTPAVLDLLDDRVATFFCIGARAERHPEIVAEIVRRGHRVENHTQSHSRAFSFFGWRRTAAEIDRAQSVLAAAAGRSPRWLRAPAGIRNPLLDPLLAQRDLGLVSWSRRGFDTADRDSLRVCRRLERGLEPGAILLLHDGNAARDRNGRPLVLEVLPRLLAAIDAAALTPVRLP